MELVIYSILLIVLTAFAITFGRSFFRGAPFAPTDKKTLATMIELAAIRPGERACDIGAGDGRIVTALARAGATVEGFEINPFLVIWANQRIRKAGLWDHARVYRKNLWKTDYSSFDVITVFGIPYIMRSLERKLMAELKPGSRVISNNFTFPHWKPLKREKGVVVYIKEAEPQKK